MNSTNITKTSCVEWYSLTIVDLGIKEVVKQVKSLVYGQVCMRKWPEHAYTEFDGQDPVSITIKRLPNPVSKISNIPTDRLTYGIILGMDLLNWRLMTRILAAN